MTARTNTRGEVLIGHPLIALARKLGCTEGQLYTMATAFAVAVLLVASTVDGARGPVSTTPTPSITTSTLRTSVP
jgi:hypothetical protein